VAASPLSGVSNKNEGCAVAGYRSFGNLSTLLPSVLSELELLPPTLAELRSRDRRVSEGAWSRAYKPMWDNAMVVIYSRLKGGEHASHWEDVASKTVAEVVRGVIEGKSEILNQMRDFYDLLAVTRGKARQRTDDYLRAHYRRRRDDLIDSDDLSGSGFMSIGIGPLWPKNPSSQMLSREEFDRFINQLPNPQPQIFENHFVLGHTAEEIGKKMNVSRNTILSHIHRGKQTIARWLRERDEKESNFPFPALGVPGRVGQAATLEEHQWSRRMEKNRKYIGIGPI
jgi:RNA polymerase sigma factor (sigma-70 family)